VPANVKVLAAAENIFAQIAFGISIGNGLAHDVNQIAVFATNINKTNLRSDGEARDDYTFNYRVRIMLQNGAVFAGAGLAFVAIDEDVFGFICVLGDKAPLHAGRKAGAA